MWRRHPKLGVVQVNAKTACKHVPITAGGRSEFAYDDRQYLSLIFSVVNDNLRIVLAERRNNCRIPELWLRVIHDNRPGDFVDFTPDQAPSFARIGDLGNANFDRWKH